MKINKEKKRKAIKKLETQRYVMFDTFHSLAVFGHEHPKIDIVITRACVARLSIIPHVGDWRGEHAS